MDEFPEFKRSVLEALRQPLEDRVITVSRAAGSYTFPADFTFVAAANPCPCGYYGFPDGVHYCKCTPSQIKRYRSKISGPILDRIDLFVSVPAVKPEELQASKGQVQTSKELREKVLKARQAQKERFKKLPIEFNGQMGAKEIKTFCQLNGEAQKLLNSAVKSMGLSTRSYGRVLKVARTIADLEGSERIELHHLAEALSYRSSFS